MLDRDVTEELDAEAAVRDGWLALARKRGLLDSDGLAEEVAALHALLAQSPSRVVLAGLPDLVLDPRQPNQPGTVGVYPNWCLPVAEPGPDGPPSSSQRR